MASPVTAVNMFPTASASMFSAIAADYYATDFLGNQHATLTDAFGSNPVSIAGLADQLHLPLSIWETGFTDGSSRPSADDVLSWLQTQITQVFQARLAPGKPCSDIIWFGGPVNAIIADPTNPNPTDPRIITAVQQLFDLLNTTDCGPPN
jgi:hypothetical protein